jgi:hypothetical protein
LDTWRPGVPPFASSRIELREGERTLPIVDAEAGPNLGDVFLDAGADRC